MNLRTAFGLARAETRHSWGRLSLCVFSIALGVFALTLVRALSMSVDDSLSGQAQKTMGADLTLSARQPLEQTRAVQLTAELQRAGARWANQTNFYSMLRRDKEGGRGDKATQLVRVRAVGAGYPFYGTIETDPPGRLAKLGEAPYVLVDRQIARRLALGPGDHVKLGELSLVVLGEFIAKPGSPAAGFSLAPSLYIHEKHLPATELLKTGSRVSYERYFALPPNVIAEKWKEAHEDKRARGEAPGRVRIETADDDTSNVQRFLDRLNGFLVLVALVTLLLGAVGISSSLRAFMRDKLDHAAIFRCIGITPRGLVALYGLLALFVASVGCAIGGGLGIIVPLALDRAIVELGAGFLPEGLALGFQPSAALDGVLAGLVATAAFTLAPIVETAQVSPLRILRGDVEQPDKKRRSRRALSITLLGLAIVAGLILSLADGGAGRMGTTFVLAVALCTLSLWIIASAMIPLAGWLARRTKSYALRQGVANLHRPGNQTKGVVISVGLGVLLVSTMLILQRTLDEAISIDQRRELPNLFVIDIQADEVEKVLSAIAAAGATQIDESPMVAARLTAIDGERIKEDESARSARTGDDERDRSRMLTREYFISYRAALIDSEKVVEGRFWSARPPRQEASVDTELADTLGLELGDVITLDVQGLPLDATVTSFREIQWQAVRPNSLILLSPGEIEGAPRQHVASFRIADARRYDVQTELIATFPHLTVIDVTEATETVKLLMARISVVFRGLGSLAVLAGIVILMGAVASGRYARQREAMLLKVVGATRATLTKILVTEQVALSTLGALAGYLLSEILSRVLWPIFFQVPVAVPYELLVPFLASSIAFSTALGVLVSRRVSQRPALEVLREG